MFFFVFRVLLKVMCEFYILYKIRKYFKNLKINIYNNLFGRVIYNNDYYYVFWMLLIDNKKKIGGDYIILIFS